jgi:hypothetical protein
MVEDVVSRSGQVTHVHLGGDEAFGLGTDPATKAYIAEHGKAALYLRHVEPLLDALLTRGIRPILWHDMMHDWDSQSLTRLKDKADVVVWSYSGHPDHAPPKYNSHVIKRFQSAGVTVWGASAYKGADSRGDAELPDADARAANGSAWAEVAARYGLIGVIATGWSRYQSSRVQCEPIDGALDALVRTATALHDGSACDDSTAQAFLSSLDELATFRACVTALRELRDARRQTWEYVQLYHEQMTLERHDPSRRGSGVLEELSRLAREQLATTESAAAKVRHALAHLVARGSIEQFTAERVQPLREIVHGLADNNPHPSDCRAPLMRCDARDGTA